MSNKEQIRKNLIEAASLEFEQLKEMAMQGAKKELEEDFVKRLNSLLDEAMTIKTDDATIEIEDNQILSITDNEEDDSENFNDELEDETIEVSDDEEEIMVSDDESEDEDSEETEDEMEDEESEEIEDEMEDDESEEIEDEMEDLDENLQFEIDADIEMDETFFAEQDTQNPEITPEAPATPEAAPETGIENTEVEPPVENSGGLSLDLQPLMNKLDQLLQVMQGEGAGQEDEVEIVDDETTTSAPQAAGDQAQAPANPLAEEFDLEEFDDSEDEIEFELDETEILDGEEEFEFGEELEETGRGLSNSVKRTGDRNKKKMKDGHHSPVTSLKENKAHNESNIDELKEENESLKRENEEYASAFVELRQQIQEMSDFNAKISFAYKLFLEGGFSQQEKMRISEQFDRVKDGKEAKDLYNKIVSENKTRIVKNNPSSKIKSNVVKTAKSTSKPLFESSDVKNAKNNISEEKLRMMKLAGLIKDKK